MSLLPAFEDTPVSLHSTTAWVANAAAPKFVMGDDTFASFDFAIPTGGAQPMDNDFEALFNIKFPSPVLPEHAAFESAMAGLPAGSLLLEAVTGVPQAAVPPAAAPAAPTATASSAVDKDNALQLDMFDILTPAQSPRAGPSNSNYASPAFQFSPTPGLTVCGTVDSTPAPRSNSRCSSRSSFSLQNDTTTAVEKAPVQETYVGADGKIKKLHLCPYEGCARNTRTFRSNADLQRHIRSHRGERPYACPDPECGKAYGQQNKMVNHVKQQHPALISLVEVGRSRRRTPAAAAAAARVASATSSAVSSPSRSNATGFEPSSIGPRRSVSSSRPAPYTVPSSAQTSPHHRRPGSSGGSSSSSLW